MIGEPVSHYVIVEKLGEGGMGVVYKAEDTRLRRTVALKFLPDHLSRDPRALERFLREARAASALNHPNICTIYEIDESGSRQFIAMEALAGQTLRRRIAGSRLHVSEILDIALQVTAGLEEAHAKGIIHRDIKPENIFITERGVVKILDFGLAKVAGAPSGADEMTMTGTAAAALTNPGTAMGTIAYMSPEQARGLELDARSDLFSFGAVLHEMATGRPAFAGSTSAVVFDAILHGEPASPAELNTALPAGLESVLNKALEKEPNYRYQSAAEFRIDLERLRRDSDSQRRTAADHRVTASRDRGVPWSRGRWALVGAGAIGVVTLGWAALWPNNASSTTTTPSLANAVKVTSAIGLERWPTWSPDGGALAYQSNQAGNWDIWVTQIGGGDAINRTADSSDADMAPSWSPDGRWIAFYSARDDGGFFVMPGIGGPPRRVGSRMTAPMDLAVPPAWSPDSTRLAHPEFGGGPGLRIVSLDTNEARTLPLERLPRNNSIGTIRWSPDGRWLVYTRAYSRVSANAELWLTDASSGQSIRLTDDSKKVWTPNWSADSRQLFFVSDRGGPPDLWRLTLDARGMPDGEPTQVSAGIEMIDAAFTMTGSRVAYSKGRTVTNVFRVPISSDRPARWSDATQLTFDEAEIESIDVSKDGRLAMSSDRSGNWDIWTMPAAGGTLQQVTRDPAVDAGPRWSRDTKALVFYSSRSGHREIWIQPLGEGPARQVTKTDIETVYPSWSPDGREIVAQRPGDKGIVSAESGASRHLTDVDVKLPDWSPDGKWVLFDYFSDGRLCLGRAPASGGPVEQLIKNGGRFGRWSVDGLRIFFLRTDARGENIWRLDVNSREERVLTDLSGRRGSLGLVGLTADATYLYFVWGELIGDIWVADVVRR